MTVCATSICKSVRSATEAIQEAEDTPLLTTAPAIKRMGDDKTLYSILCESFIEETPNTLRRLFSLMEQKDFADASRAAHSLKGGSAVLGATRLVVIARTFEHLLAAEQVPAVSLKAQLQHIWLDTEQALSNFLQI